MDGDCRLNLNNGVIADERDYVSNLTKGIRDHWNFNGLPNFLHSQTLPRSQESTFGCDAMIVIRHNGEAKVCLFEAKWPRLSLNSYNWDSIQKKSNISHFSDQLLRQRQWSQEAAIWELFIHEHAYGEQPRGFETWASTCVWHFEALPFDTTYRNAKEIWTHDDLTDLVTDHVRTKPKTLQTVIEQACRCSRGQYQPISRNGYVDLTTEDEDETIRVPASLESMGRDAEIFCDENGLLELLFLSVSKEASQ